MSSTGETARGLVRDYAALTVGEVFAKAAGFLAFAWLARALGPDAYGAVELAAALVMVFGLVVDFGLGPIGSREVTTDPGRAAALATGIPAARVLLCVPAALAMVAVLALLDLEPQARLLGLLYALSLLAAPWILSWLFQGLGLVRWVALASALRMGVFAVGVVVWVHGPEQLWRVGALEIASVAALAVYFVVLTRWRTGIAPRPRLDRVEVGRLLHEALPVGVSQVLWISNQYLPTLLLAALATAAQVAFFGSAHRIVMALGTFVYLYFFTLYPALVRTTHPAHPSPLPHTRADGDGPFERLARYSLRATAWAGVWVAVAATLLASPLVGLAYGAAFGEAAAPFALLAWVLPVSLISGHARYALIAAGRQRLELLAQAIGFAVTLGAGVPLVWRFGTLGASATTLVAALVVWGVAQGLAVRHVGRIPSWGCVWRPGLAALAVLALHAALPWSGPWLPALGAIAAFPLLAGGLDPQLRHDLRSLWAELAPGARSECATRVRAAAEE